METQDNSTDKAKEKYEIKDFVSFSAQLMAALRAKETERTDRLYEDPFATQLAGPQVMEMLAEQKIKMNDLVTDLLAIRTRFFDDFLLEAVSQVRQVVLLAVGMDARAFRLPWPDGTLLYELDKPEVLVKKELLLKQTRPSCNRCTIAVDLTQPWSHLLIEQGYRTDLPSVWLLEGLLMYLTESEVHNLLKTIWQIAAHGSWLGADVLNVKSLQSQDLAAQYWRSGFDYPEDIFALHGWKVQVVQPGEEKASFGRVTQQLPPRDVLDISRIFLVKASK